MTTEEGLASALVDDGEDKEVAGDSQPAASTGGEPNVDGERGDGEAGAGSDSDGDEDDNEDSDQEDIEDDEDNDDEDDPLAHLPDYVVKRVEKLRELDNERSSIMQVYLQERAALEKKYAALVKPLYKERARIVLGKDQKETTEGGDNDQDGKSTENGESSSSPGPESAAVANVDAANAQPVQGIPNFWVSAIMHNDVAGELISEEDVDALESLTDITCEDRDDGKGFVLDFHFAPNEYFHNTVLSKTYEVPNLLLSDEPLLKHVEGTKVEWKSDDKALTYRIVKKKQRGKGRNAGQVRTVSKKEDVESFFRWFEPPEMPNMELVDEVEADRLEEIFDSDYEIADAFRSHIIPRALLWYLGEAEEEQLLASVLEDEENEGGEE